MTTTNNATITETITALVAAGATPQQIADTVQALTAAQNAAVQQTTATPAATAPAVAPKKTFNLGRPDKPFIPEKIEVYAPCKKDSAGKLTDQPNGTLCLFLGTHSKISLGWDEWNIVLEQIESGVVREMMDACRATGEKQSWKL